MSCEHKELEYIGEERYEDGINKYYRCKSCGDVFVITPQGKFVRIKKA